MSYMCFCFHAVNNYAAKLELRGDGKAGHCKAGELHTVLNGMEVSMESFPPRVPNGVANGKLMSKI